MVEQCVSLVVFRIDNYAVGLEAGYSSKIDGVLALPCPVFKSLLTHGAALKNSIVGKGQSTTPCWRESVRCVRCYNLSHAEKGNNYG